MPDQRSIDSMTFDAMVTTTAGDFTGAQNKQYAPIIIPKRTFSKMRRPDHMSYQQTLEPWKDKPPHFALHLKRKEIVNTNPCDVQKVFTKQRDEHHKQAVRSRPRVAAFAPAVKMDDIPETARDIIVEHMYKSAQMINEEAAKRRGRYSDSCSPADASNLCSPSPGLPAPAQPIPRLVVQPAEYVSPEWRMDSMSWDGRQSRAYCDSTKHFWLNKLSAKR